MAEEKFDVVIVGGGLAGLVAAYRLCAAGRQVILLERGDSPGSKNVTGGRMYVEPIRRYLPEIIDAKDAPYERHVVKELCVVMDDDSSVLLEYQNERWKQEPFMSHTVLRGEFDNWLASKVAEKGGFVIPKKRVDDLLWKDGRVSGVKAGSEEIPARIVIAADGVLSFMAQKAGLKTPGRPIDFAVGIKEVYQLDDATIEDRFGVGPGEGAACLFMGAITKGILGGGFLYTNRDSLSVGIVLGLDGLIEQTGTLESHRLMDQFTARPEVQRWVRGGELKEYSAHLISEAGVNGVSRLYSDNFMIVGDAAGLALNMGLTVRGMEFAIASGVIAADAANDALHADNTSSEMLSKYESTLKESFVLKDMETFRHTRETLLENPRITAVYPKFLCDLFRDFYTIDDGPKASFYRSIKDISRKYLFNYGTVKDLLSLRRI
jgi:electron transfer flavoprotein-quinone oxidoreductase